MQIVLVGIGGFIGCCFRFGITRLSEGLFGQFPLGTLLSNVIAGFLIGVVFGLEQHSNIISRDARLFIATGVLGGLSTFSTFSMETITLFRMQRYALGAGNILMNLGFSFAGVILGISLVSAVARAGS